MAEPYFFGIDEIYIPLTTPAGPEVSRKGAAPDPERERRILRERTLSQPRVVLNGDPGSGKSTFLRRVAFELCRSIRGTRPANAVPFLPADDRRFPVLIRVVDLAKLLAADQSPKPGDAPRWIPYFLGRQGAEYRWGADEAFFERQLDAGNCLVMMDALGEGRDARCGNGSPGCSNTPRRLFRKAISS